MADIPMWLMSMGGQALGAAGSIGEGLINQQTQRETNAMQINLANTAIQRRQQDLAAAGINPLMAGKIGGAETPTLQAPQMRGLAQAGQQLGEIPQKANMLQQQAMTIENTKAETERIKAEKEKAIADALLTNKRSSWYDDETKANMKLQGHQGDEAVARTELAKAQKQTEDAVREPRIKQILQDVGLKAQQEKTEAQKTKEYTEIANNAKALYGARAKEAMEIARQLLTAGKYQLTELQQKQDIRDQEIEGWKNENFRRVIENILKNDYGRAIEWSKIPLPIQLGNQVATNLGWKTPINQRVTEPLSAATKPPYSR